MITDTTGPEIEAAYIIPSDEWERLTVYDVNDMKRRFTACQVDLSKEERGALIATMKQLLGMSSIKNITQIYRASDLDQEMFYNTFNKLMGHN